MNSQFPGPLTVAAMQVTNPINPLAGSLIKPPINRNPLASALDVGYADGGQVEETTDQMIARMAAKYGTSGAKPAAESAPPIATPAPQPAPIQPREGSGVVGLLKWRRNQIDKAANYAQGGKIRGPGTPTSDSIPAKVKQTGKPISVSTGERILSHEQDALMEELSKKLGFSSLNELLESGTGRPVGPTIKRGTAAAEFGAKIDGNPIATRDPYAMAKSQQPAAPVESTTKRPEFQGGDASMQAADPKGYAAVAATQPGAQERLFSNAQPLPTPPAVNPLVAEFAKAPVESASQPYVDGSQPIKPAALATQAANSFTESGTAENSRNPLTTNTSWPFKDASRLYRWKNALLPAETLSPVVLKAVLGSSNSAIAVARSSTQLATISRSRVVRAGPRNLDRLKSASLAQPKAA